jgi:hypothetical protein
MTPISLCDTKYFMGPLLSVPFLNSLRNRTHRSGMDTITLGKFLKKSYPSSGTDAYYFREIPQDDRTLCS